jgi:hypothetical protein
MEEIMNNMELWDKVKSVPPTALKEIKFGKLKGKSDISPQWRMERLTEVLGPCGVGWYYDIVETWVMPDEKLDGLMCFVQIDFFHKVGEEWSKAIPAIGGNFLIIKDKNGIHGSDDGYKMALTDAIGVAGKAIGLASDIYMGQGGKYSKPEGADKADPSSPKKPLKHAKVNERENTDDTIWEMLATAWSMIGDQQGKNIMKHNGLPDRILTCADAQTLVTLINSAVDKTDDINI